MSRKRGTYGAGVWITSYIVPIAVAWPLWPVSQGLSITVAIILTVAILTLLPRLRDHRK